jgi:hypothetical protein
MQDLTKQVTVHKYLNGTNMSQVASKYFLSIGVLTQNKFTIV